MGNSFVLLRFAGGRQPPPPIPSPPGGGESVCYYQQSAQPRPLLLGLTTANSALTSLTSQTPSPLVGEGWGGGAVRGPSTCVVTFA